MSQQVSIFFDQLLSLSFDDISKGFRGVMFGGSGVVGPYPYRGTPNPFEHPETSSYKWNSDGTFNTDSWWLHKTMTFMSVHYEIPFLLALLYVIVVFGIQFYLRNKEPVTWLTRQHIGLWNIVLAVFSIAGSAITLPATYRYIFSQGHTLAEDVCRPFPEWDNPWTFYFCLSKVPELLDTVFLALKKKPIIFLHWYHHIATMIYCWDAWALVVPQGGFFATMNLAVHSIMYTYYAIQMLQLFPIPAFIPPIITTLQILQMFGGMVIIYFCLNNCYTSYLANDFRLMLNLVCGMIMYVSYAVLFINLFARRYLAQKKNPTTTTAAATQSK